MAVSSLNLLFNAAMNALGGNLRLLLIGPAAIGDFDDAEPIGEHHPMQPTSTYGCSKAAMDYVLRGLWRRVPLDICSLRLTTVYGPGRETAFFRRLPAVKAALQRSTGADRPARRLALHLRR